MIGIRADANSVVASGHIMRCISIAKELKKKNQDVAFITADHGADDYLRRLAPECEHIVLDSKWDDIEREIPLLLPVIESKKIELLLIDSYKATNSYTSKVSDVCRTAYIDDLHESVFPVDLLINYNGYAFDFDYNADYSSLHGYRENPTKLLLGLKYAPLREQFKNINRLAREVSPDAIDVMLASGGGDSLHVLSGVLERARKTSFPIPVHWHVIMGAFISNREELTDIANQDSNIILHENVDNMATLMGSCDIGITAAGTMLTESAACALPSIYYISADNQRYEADYWCKNGLMIYAGDMCSSREDTINKIVDEVKRLSIDHQMRQTMSSRLMAVVDGRGSERIAKEIVEITNIN